MIGKNRNKRIKAAYALKTQEKLAFKKMKSRDFDRLESHNGGPDKVETY
jgi:predicted secreted Zn-dependent protease